MNTNDAKHFRHSNTYGYDGFSTGMEAPDFGLTKCPLANTTVPLYVNT